MNRAFKSWKLRSIYMTKIFAMITTVKSVVDKHEVLKSLTVLKEYGKKRY